MVNMIASPRLRLTRLALGACLALLAGCEAAGPTDPGSTPSGPQSPPPTPTPSGSGVLVLSVEGLDNGVPADIVVSGPGGFSRSVSSQASITGLAAGRYSVLSREVRADGDIYTPATPNQDVDVGSDGIPAAVKVTYKSREGAVLVTVTGLPGGTPSDISVTPPTGATISVAATRWISPAKGGRWRLAASPVSSSGNTYRPSPASQEWQLTVGDTVQTPVSYALATGSIAVAVTGLPAGTPGIVSVTGPGGYNQSVTGTITLTDLVPGSYVINAVPVSVGGFDFTPNPIRRTVTVTASLVAAAAPVAYEGSAGRIAISTTNLPASVTPTFTITGSSGSSTLNGAGTSELLSAGSYTVSAATLTSGGTTYTPSPATASVSVSAGATTPHVVNYTASGAAASLAIAITGITGSADVLVTGPSGYSRAVTTSTTLQSLAPGRYTILARRVETANGAYGVTPAQRDVDVLAGTAGTVTLAYAPLPAVVEVPVSGLPVAGTADITVTQPSGATSVLNASSVFSTAAPGRWRLAASPVVIAGSTYAPQPASYDQSVLAGDTLRMPVAYALSTGAIAISIGGLPVGAAGSVTVTGPGGYAQTVTATTTLTNLQPGSYTVNAASVIIAGVSYLPTPTTRTVSVTASAVAAAAPVSYAAQSAPTGSLVLTVSGLGTGVAADLLVTGPNSYSQAVTASGTLSNLTAGTYTITARNVRTALGTYGSTPASRDVSVPSGGSASASVAYAALPALVDIPVSGLPGGAAASITVTPPVAAAFAVTASTSVNPAATGRWRLAASNVFNGGNTYTPSPASYDQTVLAGDTLRFPVAYALSTGSIAVSVGGLPGAANGSVTVTGPGAFSQVVTATTTLTNLAPGTYTVTAAPVVVSGITYTPSPTSRSVTVTASLVAAAAAVTYTSQAGSLAITISGLSVAGDLLVTGPGGYSQGVTATQTLAGLVPGTYTISVRNVRTAQGTYGATPASRDVSVPAGGSASNTVAYAALPALVNVPVSGLPGGASAAITMTSPSGATSSVTASTTIDPAATGRWRLAASNVASGGNTYAPTPASYDQSVLAGDTLNFPVAYALSTGSIAVSVTGLPGGTNGSVTVTGPGSYSQSVTATTTLTNLVPGAYTVTAASVVSGGITYAPTPTSRAVTVTASLVAAAAPVTYSSQAGSLAITVSGLSVAADLLVTGPNSYSQAVTATTTLNGLVAGTYNIAVRNVRTAQGTYGATPASRDVAVSSGATASNSVVYAALPSVVSIPVTGLPGGTNAAITMTAPSGTTSGVTATTTISPAASGRWRLAAASVLSGGNTYAPTPASYDQRVLAGDTLRFPVTYAISTGSIAVGGRAAQPAPAAT